MMSADPIDIRMLMIARLTKDNSQEQDQYLDRLLAEHAHVREQWEQLQEQFAGDITNNFNRLDNINWIPVEDITVLTQQKKHTTNIFRYTTIAAALVAGLFAGFYFLKTGRQSDNVPKVAGQSMKANTAKQITLQLANGQVIDLSAEKNNIQTGIARLNNTGKTLSYTLAAASANAASSINSLTVPTGKDYRLTLSDGTEVWLNSATRLDFSFAFTGKTREITLNGEAYLKVAPNARQPFIVHTPQGTVQVLGTAFNINSYDSATLKVALVEGAVRLQSGSQSATLQPGIEAVCKSNRDIQMHSFDSDEVLGWKEGKYYFNDASLTDIIAVLPRWFGIEVVIDKPGLQTEVFTGRMDRNKPVTFFLENLQQTMNIQYAFDNKGVLHIK